MSREANVVFIDEFLACGYYYFYYFFCFCFIYGKTQHFNQKKSEKSQHNCVSFERKKNNNKAGPKTILNHSETFADRTSHESNVQSEYIRCYSKYLLVKLKVRKTQQIRFFFSFCFFIDKKTKQQKQIKGI